MFATNRHDSEPIEWKPKRTSPFLETIFLALIKHVRFARAKIDNFGTSIAILLQNGTLLTIVRITHAGSTAGDTPSLIGSIIAFIANAHQRGRANVGITNHTFAVTLLAQPSNGNASLLATENQIRMMSSHFEQWFCWWNSQKFVGSINSVRRIFPEGIVEEKIKTCTNHESLHNGRYQHFEFFV